VNSPGIRIEFPAGKFLSLKHSDLLWDPVSHLSDG